MTPSTQQILDAMAAQLKAQLIDVDTFTFFPDNFSAPIAVCWPGEVRYHGAFGQGDVEHDCVVGVFIARQSESAAMQAINQFLSYTGINSIREALEVDPTLGATVDTLNCIDGKIAGIVTAGEAQYIRLDFSVTVYP